MGDPTSLMGARGAGDKPDGPVIRESLRPGRERRIGSRRIGGPADVRNEPNTGYHGLPGPTATYQDRPLPALSPNGQLSTLVPSTRKSADGFVWQKWLFRW